MAGSNIQLCRREHYFGDTLEFFRPEPPMQSFLGQKSLSEAILIILRLDNVDQLSFPRTLEAQNKTPTLGFVPSPVSNHPRHIWCVMFFPDTNTQRFFQDPHLFEQDNRTSLGRHQSTPFLVHRMW